MGTVELYEKSRTEELQSLLKEFEEKSEETEILIDDARLKNQDYQELQRISNDYEIDIRLIHRELNRRLWFGDF